VVAHLVRDDVRLREVTGRTEAPGERPEEVEVDVDLLVLGAVERAHRRARHPARRLHGAGEEHERGIAVLAVHRAEQLAPGVFRVGEHDRDEFARVIATR
jgi:hypothetical protein